MACGLTSHSGKEFILLCYLRDAFDATRFVLRTIMHFDNLWCCFFEAS